MPPPRAKLGATAAAPQGTEPCLSRCNGGAISAGLNGFAGQSGTDEGLRVLMAMAVRQWRQMQHSSGYHLPRPRRIFPSPPPRAQRGLEQQPWARDRLALGTRTTGSHPRCHHEGRIAPCWGEDEGHHGDKRYDVMLQYVCRPATMSASPRSVRPSVLRLAVWSLGPLPRRRWGEA